VHDLIPIEHFDVIIDDHDDLSDRNDVSDSLSDLERFARFFLILTKQSPVASMGVCNIFTLGTQRLIA